MISHLQSTDVSGLDSTQQLLAFRDLTTVLRRLSKPKSKQPAGIECRVISARPSRIVLLMSTDDGDPYVVEMVEDAEAEPSSGEGEPSRVRPERRLTFHLAHSYTAARIGSPSLGAGRNTPWGKLISSFRDATNPSTTTSEGPWHTLRSWFGAYLAEAAYLIAGGVISTVVAVVGLLTDDIAISVGAGVLVAASLTGLVIVRLFAERTRA